MIKLFIPYTNLNINVAGIIQTRMNMNYTLDEGYLQTSLKNCRRMNNKNESYGLYLTYDVPNIETIMQIINEADILQIDYVFNYSKQGLVYVIYAEHRTVGGAL